ncbi:MAG: FAD-dependent pyridine nucleotide-disulfide oxidoreductase [Nitrospira sp.]|jgi:sulfide:quinone oxidoreductase|nr:MAG: FAD-dependent pyridine nucleotide-disulfide oxidoreductase [Nitrospira sp.]
MTDIVVIGAGIAGVPAAYELKRRLGGETHITVISDREYFHFIPSNPALAVGWRVESDVAFPIKPYLEHRGIGFAHGSVTAIDADHSHIVMREAQKLTYDFIMIACGAVPRWQEVPGLTKLHSVLDLEQALTTRQAYERFVNRPGPIAIGAVPGASILGSVYEYAFLVDADLRRRGIRRRAPITVITPEPYLGHLGLGGSTLQGSLTHALAAHDIRWIGNAETIGVTEENVHIVRHRDDGSMKKEDIPYVFGVYWPRFGGIPAIADSALPTDAHGLLKVDHYLRSERYENVFAAGICIAPTQAFATPVEVGLPQTVDAIQEEVRIASHNLVASLQGRPLQPANGERRQRVMKSGQDRAAYMSALRVPVGDITELKQGRWVYEAKKEFENQFLNMVMFGFEQSSHVAEVIRTIRSTSGSGQWAIRHRGRQLVLELDPNLYAEVGALASVLSQDPSSFASALLAAAIQDAKACLTAAERTEAQRFVQESLTTALRKEEEEQLQFEGGAS